MKCMKINAVKEALDNLPTGICFFDRRGLPVLCNLQMQITIQITADFFILGTVQFGDDELKFCSI